MVDIDTRNAFTYSSRSKLKHIIKTNLHCTKIEEINNNSILNFCLYYYRQDSWSYVVQYKVINNKKKSGWERL